MKRIPQRLFAIYVFSSLLMCMATCALWVRSLWKGDLISFAADYLVVIRSEDGLVFVNVSRAEADEKRGIRHDSWPSDPTTSMWRWLGPRWWDRLGFGHYVGGTSTGGRVDQVAFPYYAVAIVNAMLPAWVSLKWLRARRRRRVGLCPKCGYDLRATPGRCPECGHEA